MIDIKEIVSVIEKLLAEDTPQSVTYAALECRLAIEKICYDRLKVNYDYISHSDLRGWRPGDVVKTLITDVDGGVASEQTIYMSKQPSATYQESIENIPDAEWVKIGTQAGFDVKLLSSYWQSLSHLALHVALPKTKDDEIPKYGDFTKTKRKVVEILAELKRLADVGNLLTTGLGETQSFKCECDRTIQRRSALLKHGQIINCVGVECDESFEVSIKDNDFWFARRLLRLDCKGCGKELAVQTRIAEKLERDRVLTLECTCGAKNNIMWRLMRQNEHRRSIFDWFISWWPSRRKRRDNRLA
jgi:hypothetical protein